MGNFIGSTSVEVMGEDIDINDDLKLRDKLGLHCSNLLAGIKPKDAVPVLLAVLTDVQLVTVKLAFVLNQCGLAGANGVSLTTLSQFYDQIAKIAGLTVQPDTTPAIVDAGGDVIDAEIVEPPEPADEL